MTSTTDTTGHPDVAEISDLTEGLLPPSRTAEIQRHLDDCALCADVHDSLEEIRGLLGTLPGPPRMPDDVAGRIDAALAAEALLNATTASEDAVPGEYSPAHVSRETSAGADRPGGRSSGTTGPGRKGSKDRKRGRRRRVVLGAVLTAAVLGAGSLFLQSLGGDDHPAQTTTAADTFSKAGLKSQVTDLLSGAKSATRGSGTEKPWGVQSEPNPPSGGVSPKTLIEPSVSVPACVRQGIHRDATDVLGAKKGTYDGKSAYLVVLPAVSDTTRVTAYIVDATCLSQQSAAPGKVLLSQSYDRP